VSRRIRIPAKDSKRWFGKPLSIQKLNAALQLLHSRLLPLSTYEFDKGNGFTRYEELLHELGHHVTLSPHTWPTPRDQNVGTVLEEMSPSTREGNECDALAFTILVSEMIGRPISIGYVDMAVRQNNLKFMTIRQARRMVMSSLTAPNFWDLGYNFATELYSVLHAQGEV